MAELILAPTRLAPTASILPSQVLGLQKAIIPFGYPAPRPSMALGIPLSSGGTTPTITLSSANPTAPTLTCGMTITFGTSVNGGTYTITIGSQTTGNITYSSTLTTQQTNIKAAVESLSNIGIGGVWSVSQTSNIVTIVFVDSVVTAIRGSAFSATNVALSGGSINAVASAGTSVPLIPNCTPSA